MTDEPLPVAVIGVGGVGASTLAAVRQSELMRLVGLADTDPGVAQRAGNETGAPAYTDNRSLLAETRPAAVFLALPPGAAAEVIPSCVDRGIHIWKELPLARNLGEGVAMTDLAEGAGLKLAVGTQRRFARGYAHAWQARQSLGPVFELEEPFMKNRRSSQDLYLDTRPDPSPLVNVL